MLIADDVGIGKTIEGGLIARELLDRGDIQHICVLCPPHLCDQWQTELERKFHIPAVVLRSSTVARLERDLPRRDLRVWQYYPYIVASIDLVKMTTRRDEYDMTGANVWYQIKKEQLEGADLPIRFGRWQPPGRY